VPASALNSRSNTDQQLRTNQPSPCRRQPARASASRDRPAREGGRSHRRRCRPAGDEDLVEAMRRPDGLRPADRNHRHEMPKWPLVGARNRGLMPKSQGRHRHHRPGAAIRRVSRRASSNSAPIAPASCTCASARPLHAETLLGEPQGGCRKTSTGRKPSGSKGPLLAQPHHQRHDWAPASTLTSPPSRTSTGRGLSASGCKVLNMARPRGTPPAKTAGGQLP